MNPEEDRQILNTQVFLDPENRTPYRNAEEKSLFRNSSHLALFAALSAFLDNFLPL